MSSSPIEPSQIESPPIESPPMTNEEFEGIMSNFSDREKVSDDDITALQVLIAKYCSDESADTLSLCKGSSSIFQEFLIPHGYKLPGTICSVTSKSDGSKKYVIALPGRSQDPVQVRECFKEFPEPFTDLSFSIAIASMGIDVSKYKEIPELEVQSRGKGSYKVLTGPEFAIIITDKKLIQLLPRIRKTIIIEDGSRG
jgi:hypothetical protein